jgi:hypothetical protein
MLNRLQISLLVAASGSALVLGGCTSPTPVVGGPAATVTTTSDPRVVTYPEGRWQLIGTGAPNDPYYWVWVPTGVVAAPTPPIPVPAVPGAVVVSNPPPRVVTHQQGQYTLYGDGTSVNPYYWVWVPAGTNPPPPPRLPQLR